MKTIFDKIDPKYLECTTGTCEHTSHAGNIMIWLGVIVLSVNILVLLSNAKQYK